MNLKIFRLINNLINHNILLDKVMIFFSKDVIDIFAGLLLLFFLIGVLKKNDRIRRIAVSTVLFTVINLILGYIIGTFYYVDRPFVHNSVNLLYPHVKDASFPSDHVIVTMSIALGLSKYNKTLGLLLTLLSLITGFSRIYVGHHFPFDIIGTYIIVLFTGYLYHTFLSSKISAIYDKIERVIAKKLGLTWLYN